MDKTFKQYFKGNYYGLGLTTAIGVNQNWQIRGEVGFYKRLSILLNANYRFNL